MKKIIFLLIVIQVFINCITVYASRSEVTVYSVDGDIDDVDSIGVIRSEKSKNDVDFDDFYENVSSVGEKQAKIYIFFNNSLFKEFIKEPNRDFLNKINCYSFDDVGIYDYYTSKDEDSGMRFISLNDPDLCTVYKSIYDRSYNQGYYFFQSEEFKDIDKESLQKYLSLNGINEKIENISYIVNSDYPSIIFIETELNSYFWVYNGANSKGIMYDIYTTEEFQEKATEKFKNIYLDNKKLDGEENVIVCWEKGYIKATAFIEILGGKNIKWNNEYRSISFELNGKEIEYFTDSKYCVEKYGAEFKYYYIFINGVPYTDTYCSLPSIFINDYIYFNEDDVEMFLKNLTEKQIMKDKTNQDIFITTN